MVIDQPSLVRTHITDGPCKQLARKQRGRHQKAPAAEKPFGPPHS
jgi:hypothetical protein